ncbi:hypothetical protein AVEN_212753-1 [Araneus ventricosus]|uniref:Uncharacterized protein n=1 Tax=Araneus ventricosus TaxID=182803 RepID=A0A4Y2GXL2_ARAVE|nr:hypothetical protein AVEN_212753-1 [Araneus ventricosus]
MLVSETSLFVKGLTSRFEATRGLFWKDLVILNRGQMTRTTPELAPASRSFRATPARGRLAHDVRRQAHTYGDLQWKQVSNLNPSGPAIEILPLSHRGRKFHAQIISQPHLF